MERGATTANCVWASASPSEARGRAQGSRRSEGAQRGGLSGRSGRSGRSARAGRRLALGAALTLLLLLAQAALAQTAQALWQQGEFAAAYEKAAQAETAPLQTLAARAAADQVVYVLAPAGATLEQELVWLRRAVQAAEAAVRLDPTSADALVYLARAKGEIARRSGVLQNLNVAGELKALFDRALALEPDHPDALVGLAMWNLELVENGVGWLYGGRRSEVLPLLERGVAAAPEQVNLRVEYATALRALGLDREATEQLRTALALPARTAVDRGEQRRAEALLR